MRGLALASVSLALAACAAGPRKAASPQEARYAMAGETVVTEAQGGGEAEAPPADAKPSDKKQARMVIKTAELEIITTEPQDGFDKAIAMAKGMGGFTLDSDRSDTRISVTLRIPAARFEEALKRLTKLGKVERREVQGRDVTAEFVDLTLRLRNAERMHRRYQELLAKAANVGETLQVEKEVERVTNTIESLKGQINLIENQVSLSTIRLSLEVPTRPGPLGWIFYGLYKGIVWLFVW